MRAIYFEGAIPEEEVLASVPGKNTTEFSSDVLDAVGEEIIIIQPPEVVKEQGGHSVDCPDIPFD